LEKQKHTLNREHYTLREISILESHLDRLGFENKNQKSIQGINIFPIRMALGKDNMDLNFVFFGYKVIQSNMFQTFKSNYQKKYNELKRLTNQEYDKNYMEIHEQVKSELSLITNVNQLFKKLESLNFIIENKDTIISGK